VYAWLWSGEAHTASMKRFCVIPFVLFFALCPSSPSLGADLAPLLERLRAGGYIIYVRHAATVPDQVDRDTGDLDDCSQQRQLSDLGREQAARIGNGFRQLGIPVGRVLSSEYCRCLETARIAFGRAEPSDALNSSLPLDEQHTRARAEALRALMSEPPAPGSNDIMVGHMSNLFEAVGVYPKPEGVAVIFRPGRDGLPELVGIVPPDDWPEHEAGDEAE